MFLAIFVLNLLHFFFLKNATTNSSKVYLLDISPCIYACSTITFCSEQLWLHVPKIDEGGFAQKMSVSVFVCLFMRICMCACIIGIHLYVWYCGLMPTACFYVIVFMFQVLFLHVKNTSFIPPFFLTVSSISSLTFFCLLLRLTVLCNGSANGN